MSTPVYPPPADPEPLSEHERVLIWREDVLIHAGYPDLEATKIAASDCDLHRAVELLAAGCSIHTALEILT